MAGLFQCCPWMSRAGKSLFRDKPGGGECSALDLLFQNSQTASRVSSPEHHSSPAPHHGWGRQFIPAYLPLQVQHSSSHPPPLTFLLLPVSGKLSLPKYPHFQSFLHHLESLPSPPASLGCFPTTPSEPLELPKGRAGPVLEIKPSFLLEAAGMS